MDDVAAPDPRHEALDELQRAALAAQEALQERDVAQGRLDAAKVAWDDARYRLQRAQEHVSSWFGTPEIASPAEQRHEQLLHGGPAAVEARPNGSTDIPEVIPGELIAEHRRELEPADDAPEVVTRAADPTSKPAAAFAAFARDRAEQAAGGGPGLSPSQQRVLDALRTAKGDLRAAAEALGVSGNAVQTSLRHIGEKGGIPIELIPMLPAGYAKYRPAGL